jgi:hypothetical protein
VVKELEQAFGRVINIVKEVTAKPASSQLHDVNNTRLYAPSGQGASIIPPSGAGSGSHEGAGISRNIHKETGARAFFPNQLRSFAAAIKEPILKIKKFGRNSEVATLAKDSSNPATTVPPQERSRPNLSQTRPVFRSIAKNKISQILEERKKGVIVCYRCGEINHTSRDCRNAIVFFECTCGMKSLTKSCLAPMKLPA